MRYVKYFTLICTFILFLGVTDAQENKKSPETSTDETQPEKKQKSEEYLKKLKELKSEFQKACDKAIADGSSNTLYLLLFAYNKALSQYPELKPLIQKYFEKYSKIRESEIACIENSELKVDMLCKLADANIEIINNHQRAEKLVLQAIEMCEDYEKIEKMYQSIDYAKYVLPYDKYWEEIIQLYVCKDKLNELQNSDNRWVSKKQLNDLKLLEQEVLREYEKLKIKFKKDPFFYEAYKEKEKLRNTEFYSSLDFKIIAAQPFAFVLVKKVGEEENPDHTKFLIEQISMLQQFWKQVKEDWIVRLKLKSNRKDDSLENPKPFNIIVFNSKALCDEYLKKIDKVLPDFAYAYFSPLAKYVATYLPTRLFETADSKSDGLSDMRYVLHEVTHQIVDRYSSATDGLKGVHSIFITDGFAEYMQGCEKDEKTGEYKFGSINYKPRMQIFGVLKKLFGHRDSYVYDNLKDEENLPFLPPREDWNLVPVECLLVSCIRGVVYWYGSNLASIYRAGFAKAYNESDPKDNELLVRANKLMRFQGGPQTFIYACSFAYSWAFTHFLIEKYPKQYDEIFKEVLSGNSLPQAFVKAFKLDLELPEVKEYIESNEKLAKHNKELVEALIKQIKMLQENEKVQNIEDAFHTWLYKKYEEVMGKPIVDESEKPQTQPQTKPSKDDGADEDDGW